MKQWLFSKTKVFRGRLKIVVSALKYMICRVLPRMSKEEIWVICERGTDARDNGFAFYQYMVKEHPEISVHYLITKNSADYEKVKDHAVEYGSLKNYRLVATADKIISTHCYTALPVKSEKLWRKMGLEKRFYFLQHGVIKEQLPYLYGNKTGMQFFCCAALPEYEFIKAYFKHPDGVVQCTGLARYDNLLTFETKRQILIMPTWRRYLKDEKSFQISDYFKCWNAVLDDRRLTEYLEKTDTTLVFYPHYELQPYLKHFTTASSKVVLANFKCYDVQKLLKESMLLITDYSSVCFDFAYMKKPSLYYQFDQEEYHKKHYKEGYFSFTEHGFGAVVKEHNTLIHEILCSAESQYQMEPHYEKRTDAFFAYRDQKNCERIYEAIKNR